MKPPGSEEVIKRFLEDVSATKIFIEAQKSIQATTDEGEYLHWEKIRYFPPPLNLSSEQWWFFIKMARSALYKKLPFEDKYKKPFVIGVPDVILRKLRFIDRASGKGVQNATLSINKNFKETYVIQSLIEEAITSSQLEGASTTRRVAKEMLKTRRKPVNLSEKMISNNYEAMQFVREIKGAPLSKEIILELHRILTKDTLENPCAIGQLRKSNDINIWDNTDQILHVPPDFHELEERIQKICNFANAKETDSNFFIHPVIRAILLHFILVYDHPFEDGNGRTARALFYWSMSNQGYELIEYISISQIIKKNPNQYALAYLHTETDSNDTTYFVIQQMDIILKAIDALYEFITEKNQKTREIEALVYTNETLRNKLNPRQIGLIMHALEHPKTQYLIESHRKSHNITYQTARTDLLELTELGIFIKEKIGKAFVFMYNNANAVFSTHSG